MTIEKLLKCLELTRSDNDSEALVAIRKANAIRTQLNVGWSDLLPAGGVTPPPAVPGNGFPPISVMLYELQALWLVGKQAEFINGLASYHGRYGRLTPKQLKRLEETFRRHFPETGAA